QPAEACSSRARGRSAAPHRSGCSRPETAHYRSWNRKESPMHEPSVRVVRRDQFSDNTPQTSGLHPAVAFATPNPHAKVLSALVSTVLPGAATGAHHHGDQETILY